MKKQYYLCTEEIVENFPSLEKSKPFKSGYEYGDEVDKNYYVVLVDEEKDWPEIEAYFEKNEASEAWIWCIQDSQLDIGGGEIVEDEDGDDYEIPGLSLEECKEIGLFAAIEQHVSVTKPENIAYALYKLAEKENMSPIELVNNL